MIDESFLTKLEKLAVAAGRPTTLTHEHRTLVLQPNGLYVELDRYVKQTGKVANVACLVDIVLEEARRRENADGEFMTVCFTEGGAFFSPDDRVRLDGYTYERVLAPEWRTIRDLNGKTMKHAEFLRALQSLRWCLQGAPSVIRAFRSVDVSRVARIGSAPTMVDGKAGMAFSVEIAAKMLGGGETQAMQQLPGELFFAVPFARGDASVQTLEAEVVIEMARDGEKETVLFGFIIPDIAAVERNARAAEVSRFRAALGSLPGVLVLENF